VEVQNLSLQSRIGKLLKVTDHSSWRMRYHAFVSHAQLEASGDVGTVFLLAESLGLHGWRDMNQPDLTAQGMMQGVFDSDVFILFLTSSVLSRKYCQMELGWAIAFNKPIMIIYEEEERFFPFNLERWQNDYCVKAPLPAHDKVSGEYIEYVTEEEKKQRFRWAKAPFDPLRWQNDLCVKVSPLPQEEDRGEYMKSATKEEKEQGFRWVKAYLMSKSKDGAYLAAVTEKEKRQSVRWVKEFTDDQKKGQSLKASLLTPVKDREYVWNVVDRKKEQWVQVPLPPQNKHGEFVAKVTEKEMTQGFRWAHGLPQGGLPHKECPAAIHDWITAAMKSLASSLSSPPFQGKSEGDALMHEIRVLHAAIRIPSAAYVALLRITTLLWASPTAVKLALKLGLLTVLQDIASLYGTSEKIATALQKVSDAVEERFPKGVPDSVIDAGRKLLPIVLDATGADAVAPPKAILPFRRRDFEVTALMRELVRCVGHTKDVTWGGALPPTPAERMVRSPPPNISQRLHMIWDGSSNRATVMMRSLKSTFEDLNERYGYTNHRITCTGDVSSSAGLEDVKQATHIIVVLTNTRQQMGASWLSSATAAAKQMECALQRLPNPWKFTFIYDKPKGLNSDVFNLSPLIADRIKYAIWGHEALVFRDRDEAHSKYEHESMVRHVFKLMTDIVNI